MEPNGPERSMFNLERIKIVREADLNTNGNCCRIIGPTAPGGTTPSFCYSLVFNNRIPIRELPDTPCLTLEGVKPHDKESFPRAEMTKVTAKKPTIPEASFSTAIKIIDT